MDKHTTDSAFSLTNKRILVTGASSGLGRAIAITLSHLGANVICVGRDEIRLRDTYSKLMEGQHSYIQADLTNENDRHNLVESSGILNGIVHCAGISRLSPVRLISENHLDELNRINVYAPILLTMAILRKNKLKAEGSILFIASIAAHIGVPGVAAYSGTKSAIIAMARCLAMEVVKKKIRVNCLSPALVATPLLDATAKLIGTLEAEKMNYPLGFGRPEDVAYASAFFMADASRWITGSDLIMDGGLTVN